MATQVTTLKLGPGDDGRALSAEQFAASEFAAAWRYERVEGRLLVSPPAEDDHVGVSEPLRDRLGAYRLANPGVVERVVSEAWIRPDDRNDRIGDIGVYLRTPDPAPPIPDRIPDLAFEIVSPGRRSSERDYVEKRDQYHRLGVRKYVIVDRTRRRVTVLTHEPAAYSERVPGPADSYASPLLPRLVVPLAELIG
jgi:Uma2 family endonuclease